MKFRLFLCVQQLILVICEVSSLNWCSSHGGVEKNFFYRQLQVGVTKCSRFNNL